MAFLRFFLCLSVFFFPLLARAQEAAVQRGAYVFHAAGGCACHTDIAQKGATMAGGRPLKTPFGIIYSSNITADAETGLGKWSDDDFIRAMTHGIGPDGTRYFPVFPYTSFTKMTEQDLRDLKAYLFSLPAVKQANKPHELRTPYGWRIGIRLWKWLYFDAGTFQATAAQSPAWNRGAYLATALGHCTECHTPRTRMGGLQAAMAYAGAAEGPEGETAPNITPDPETGIGRWSTADFVWFMQSGFKPEGDDTQGLMSELIEHGYKHLSEADLQAMAAYFQALPPIRHKVEKPQKAQR